MTNQDKAKQAAAQHALSFVQEGMTVGLGSGSTATIFIRLLGERVKQGLHVRGIASSDDSERLARELGIPLTDFHTTQAIDVAIDGADEVAPLAGGGLALIKGGGGKLLREKIVASASKRFLIVADATKVVPRLGRFPLPVEVIRMAAPLVEPQLRALGFDPRVRPAKDGSGDYITDEGNLLFDCHSDGIADPARLAATLDTMVGVVEHGLFLGMAERALIAEGDSVREILAGGPFA